MKKAAFIALFFAVPLVASAQQLLAIRNLVQAIAIIVNMLIPVLITIALIVFFWGLIKYIGGSGKGHEAGKKVMIAGLVSLFVMVSIWGILALAQGALGVEDKTQINLPRLPLP